MRIRKRKSENAEVPLSPLIDCVFLLLIFFLVTSMIKRWEQQIPVSLADPTAQVATTTEDTIVQIGIDADGNAYRGVGRNRSGEVIFEEVGPLPAYLGKLMSEGGPDQKIDLAFARGTDFQTVIDNLDLFEIQGFTDVGFRVRNEPFSRK